jgi:hypothetical protein
MSEDQRETRKEVIKHSAAIQIQNNITLLQRRAWNVLLYHAYHELPSEEVHKITVRELADILDYESHNEEYLKEALRGLVRCLVEWNILSKDGKEQWGVANLLAQAVIENGMCSYAYAPEIRKRLHNPSMYARLDLSLQNKFASKHTQALWELCTDYLGSGRDYGETPFIGIEQFKRLMGIAEEQYPLYKLFSQRVLRPAVDEINRLSDFHVTVEQQHQGRKVMALKFKIRRVVMLPGGPSHQPELFPELVDLPAIVHRLTDAGLTMHEALMIWNKGFDGVEPEHRPEAGADFETYLTEKIALLHLRQEESKVTNASGFLLMAIKKNYTNMELTKRAAARERGRTTKELHLLKAKRETILKEQDAVLRETCTKVIEAYPNVVEQAVAAMRGENDAAMRYYDSTKTPVENYHARAAVQIAIGRWLERLLPEEFERKRAPFQRELEAIETRMEALAATGIKASA